MTLSGPRWSAERKSLVDSQAVPDPRLGADVARHLRVSPQLAPKRADIHPKQMVMAGGCTTPHLTEELLVRQHLAVCLHERFQQIVLGWSQRHGRTSQLDQPPRQIDLKIPSAEGDSRRSTCRA